MNKASSDKMVLELGDKLLRPGAWVAVPKGMALNDAHREIIAALSAEESRYKEIWE
ncbi:MAG: hypothetical protein HN344_09725 [Gammaproteobacteria bacterium]|nr:hypothetical protein [Gammaproteobacteria bacterium]